MGQWVAPVSINAKLSHHHVRGKTLQQRRHYQVKGPKKNIIIGLGKQRHIYTKAPPVAFAQLISVAGAGKEKAARLVKGDG